MNILILTKYNNEYGVVTHVINLANELARLDDKVYVMAPLREDGTKGIYSKLENVEFIPMSSGRSIVQKIKKIRNICKEYKIDIIHSHNRSTSILAQVVKSVLGIPFVWTMHLNNIPCDLIHRKLTFPGDRVIAVSSELKEFGISKLRINEDRFTVISNGINEHAYFQIVGREVNELRAKWNIEEDEKVITILSRLEKVKGHATLLKALKALNQIPYKLLITGNDADDGSYRRELMELSQTYGLEKHVEFIGYVNANQVLNVSDLMVLPSENEGQAITILESFILRVPVIRTRTGGYEDMKEYCIGVDVGDFEALGRYMLDILRNPEKYSGMMDAAKKYVRSSCTNSIMGRSVRKVYEKVLSEVK